MTLGGPDVADTYWSEHRRAIADVLGSTGVKLMDATIASVEADGTVRLFIEGRPATPKSYPVIASGLPSRPGDVAWALRVGGGYVVLGRNAHPADKTLAGVETGLQEYARDYTNARVRVLTDNSILGTADQTAWPSGVTTVMRWGFGAVNGYPASGLVVSHVPFANSAAGYNQQLLYGFDGSGTWLRSGAQATGGWTAWQKMSLDGHTHDGYHSVVGHTHGRESWKALDTSWGDIETAYMKIPATNQVFLRGRVVPPSTGWTDGTTIFTLPAGYRPIAGASFFCPGGFVSGVGHVAAMMAVEADGRLRAWSSISNAIPPSIDLAPISYITDQ